MIHNTESLRNSAKTDARKPAEFDGLQLVHAIEVCLYDAPMSRRALSSGERPSAGDTSQPPIAGAMMPLKRVEGPG